MDEAVWEALVATQSPEIIRAGPRAHVERYLETNGGEDTYLTQGGPTLFLTSTGRKTGEKRISPANFMRDGDDVIVVGSIAGLDRHPGWALNLEGNPEGWAQVKDRRRPVRARGER